MPAACRRLASRPKHALLGCRGAPTAPSQPRCSCLARGRLPCWGGEGGGRGLGPLQPAAAQVRGSRLEGRSSATRARARIRGASISAARGVLRTLAPAVAAAAHTLGLRIPQAGCVPGLPAQRRPLARCWQLLPRPPPSAQPLAGPACVSQDHLCVAGFFTVLYCRLAFAKNKKDAMSRR